MIEPSEGRGNPAHHAKKRRLAGAVGSGKAGQTGTERAGEVGDGDLLARNHFETSVTSMVAPARTPDLRSRRPSLPEEHDKPRGDGEGHDDDDRKDGVVAGARGSRMGRPP